MSKQAVIYCRFSPRPDADTSKSNEKQAERCLAYCERRGYSVFKTFEDKDVSGKHLSRPGLDAAIDALKPGMVLVVDTGDRLARDTLVALTIHAQVEKRGAHVETADGAPTRSTPEGRLFSDILAAFAAYERARFARRTKAGLARKKAEGVWVGRPPIGWQKLEGSTQLVEHPGEQMAIAYARDYAEVGTPSEQIAVYLTEKFGPCRGKPWSGRMVRKILARQPAG